MTERLVHQSDLLKIKDVLELAVLHHTARDQSNAALHMAREVRYAPLTSELMAAVDRINSLVEVGPEVATSVA